MNLPRVKDGDPITDGLFNALLSAAEACGLEVGQGSGLTLSGGGSSGYVLGTALPRPFYAKITGAISGGTYPWTEQFPAASGTWTAGTRTGTGYERNANTAVELNTYVIMTWNSAGFFSFDCGTC